MIDLKTPAASHSKGNSHSVSSIIGALRKGKDLPFVQPVRFVKPAAWSMQLATMGARLCRGKWLNLLAIFGAIPKRFIIDFGSWSRQTSVPRRKPNSGESGYYCHPPFFMRKGYDRNSANAPKMGRNP